MTQGTRARAGIQPRGDHFRQIDEALWTSYGLAPQARFVSIDEPRTRLRVLDVGSGPAVILIHGTVGPGAWPSLISQLAPARFLVVERPGWGASDPLDVSRLNYHAVAAAILRGVLDAFEVDRATVLGASIGDVWALSLAERHPSRVAGVVLLGAGPFVAEVQVPRFIKLLASPPGALVVRLPVSPDRARSMLRDSGHGASLDAGRIPDVFVDWRVALSNETPAMRHERAMVRALVGRSGWRRDLVFGTDELRRIELPTRMILGTQDHVGSRDLWSRTMSLLPNGRLDLIDGAGHMPWFDEPDRVARLVDASVSAVGR